MLFAAVWMLGGCAGTNRIATAADGAGVPPHQGVVIVGFERPASLTAKPIKLDIRAVERTGSVAPNLPSAARPRSASVLLSGQKYFVGDTGGRFAFALEPGDYVIAAVQEDRQPYYRDLKPAWGGGLGGAVLEGALTGLFLGGVEGILARSAIDPEAGRAPLQYVTNGVAVPDAPRFRVQAGQVVYIGDILVGSEERQYEVDDPSRRTGPNAYDDTAKPARLYDIRLFAEYAVDEAAARGDAAALQLGHFPFRTERIRLSDRERTMFVNYRPVDSRTTRTIGDPKISLARPATGRPPPTTAITPTAPAAGQPDLIERFLSGAISREQYERERARPGSGS